MFRVANLFDGDKAFKNDVRFTNRIMLGGLLVILVGCVPFLKF